MKTICWRTGWLHEKTMPLSLSDQVVTIQLASSRLQRLASKLTKAFCWKYYLPFCPLLLLLPLSLERADCRKSLSFKIWKCSLGGQQQVSFGETREAWTCLRKSFVHSHEVYRSIANPLAMFSFMDQALELWSTVTQALSSKAAFKQWRCKLWGYVITNTERSHLPHLSIVAMQGSLRQVALRVPAHVHNTVMQGKVGFSCTSIAL